MPDIFDEIAPDAGGVAVMDQPRGDVFDEIAPDPIMPGMPALLPTIGGEPTPAPRQWGDSPSMRPMGGPFAASGNPESGGIVNRLGNKLWETGANVVADTAALPVTLPQNVVNKGGAPASVTQYEDLPFIQRMMAKWLGADEDTPENQAMRADIAAHNAANPPAPDPAATLRHDIASTIGPGEIAPPKNAAEKYLVDLPTGLAGTVAEIALQRKLLPADLQGKGPIQEAAAWEIQNQAAGGPEGHGALMGGTVGAIGKALPNAPIKALAAEGALFGASTYLTTGDIDESIVNALLPAAMRTPHAIGWVMGRLSAAKTPEARAAAVEEIKQQATPAVEPAAPPAAAAEPTAPKIERPAVVEQPAPESQPQPRTLTGQPEGPTAVEDFTAGDVGQAPAVMNPATPQPIYNEQQLRGLSKQQLNVQAVRWGVPHDAPSTTIPRILDAQQRWRVEQLTSKQLWDEVRARGLHAGNRQQNIDALVNSYSAEPVLKGGADVQTEGRQTAPEMLSGVEPVQPLITPPVPEKNAAPAAPQGRDFTYRTDEQVTLPGKFGPVKHRVGYQNAEREGKPYGGRIVEELAGGRLKVVDHSGREMTVDPAEIKINEQPSPVEGAAQRIPDTAQRSPEPAAMSEGSFIRAEDRVYQVRDGKLVQPDALAKSDGTTAKQLGRRARMVEAWIDVRDALAKGDQAAADEAKQRFVERSKAQAAEFLKDDPAFSDVQAFIEGRANTPENIPDPIQTPAPAPKTAKSKPGPFTREGLQNHLIEKHRELTGDGGFDTTSDLEFINSGTGYGHTTFFEKLPGEIERIKQNHPHLKNVFDVTDDRSKSGGEDALHDLGEDRYAELLSERMASKKSQMPDAIKTAQNSGDADLALRAALYEVIENHEGKRPTLQSVEPSKIKTGEKFTLYGHQIEIVDEGNGYRVLKDGDDFPAVPIDALDKVPMDRGSRVVETKPTAEAPIAKTKEPLFEPSPFDKPRQVFTSDAPEQRGVFDQPVALKNTGNQQTLAFETERKPAEPIARETIANKSASDPKNTAEMFAPAVKDDPRVATFRKQAESLAKQAEERGRPLTQNPTPKRMREYNSRRTEAQLIERTAKAFDALADAREAGTLPKVLESIRAKSQVMDLVRKKTKHGGGYYDAYYELPEWADETPAAKALQEMIEPKSAAQRDRDAANEKQRKIEKLETDIRFRKIEGFFPTPKPLADKMIEAADIRAGQKVLEPSAGKGDLADAIKAERESADIETIEPVPDLRTLLEAKGHKIVGSDFLEHTGQYDRIVMNPPFERGQDVEHVMHAWEQLKPGGKMVALMSEGSFNNSTKKFAEFRQWLNERDGTSEKIGPDAFKGPEAFRQTGVASRMVTIEKPTSTAREAAPSGKLEQLEQWAEQRLQEKAQARAEIEAKTPADRRRQRGSAGSFDPEDLILRAIVHGAPLVRKGFRTFTEWSKYLVQKLPELTREAFQQRFKRKLGEMKSDEERTSWVDREIRTTLQQIFQHSKKLAKLSTEDERSAYVNQHVEIPQTKTTKQIIRANVDRGMIERAVKESDALKARLRALATGEREGFKLGVASQKNKTATAAEGNTTVPVGDAIQGQMKAKARGERLGWASAVEQGEGIRRELLRITRETLPAGDREPMLSSIARTQTLGDLNKEIRKLQTVLADQQLRHSLSSLEDLTGKLQVKAALPLTRAQRVGEKPVRVPGDVNPNTLRDIDLTKLPKDVRDQINPLLDEARYLKTQMRRMAEHATISDKEQAVAKFNQIEQQVRVLAANAMAEREIEVAGKLQTLQDAVADTTRRIDAPPETDTPSGEPIRERSYLKAAWRAQYNPESTITNLVGGEDNAAYQTGIRDIRRGQEGVYGEQQKFQSELHRKLDDAGIAAHTATYDRWLSTREPLKLPDAGRVDMTRAEMLDLYGHAGDVQTGAEIIRGRARWNFENRREASPIKLSADDVDAIIAQLKPEERAIMDFFKEYRTAHLTERAMAAKLAIDQHAPDPIEGQWPRARNQRQTDQLPADWQGYQKQWLENISSMQERGKDRTSPYLIRNAIEVMSDFVDDNANLIHLAEPLRVAAAILQHPDTRAAVGRKYGTQLNRQIDQFLLDTAHGAKRIPRTLIEKAMAAIGRNVSRAWLTLSPSVVTKNVAGGTVSLMPEFSEVDLVHGVKEAAKPSTYHRMLDTSPVAWHRYEGGGLFGQYSPILERTTEPSAKLGFTDALKRGKIGSAIDAIPIMSRADATPFTVAFAAAEHFVDRTQPELAGADRTRAVLDKFHDAVYRTQNGNSSTEASYMASRARQSGPILQAFLMFTSDQSKRLNQFARWGQMNGKTRARLLTATAANAAIGALVGYGLKAGAQAIGRAISGAPVDAKQEEKNGDNLLWAAIQSIAGISQYGNWATDLAQSAIRGNDAHLGNPVTETIDKTLKNSLALITKAYKAAAAEEDSPEATKRHDQMMKALIDAQASAREMMGDPTVPLTRLGSEAIKAGSFTPPDPRTVEQKQKREKTKALRDGLPGNVQKLLAEKNRLDALGKKKTDAEWSRSAKLDEVESLYEALQQAVEVGNKSDEQSVRKQLIKAAGK